MMPHPEDRTHDVLLSLYNLAYYVRHHQGHRAHVDAALNAIVNRELALKTIATKRTIEMAITLHECAWSFTR